MVIIKKSVKIMEFKSKILNVMERSLECYTIERIENYISEVKANGLTEHGFPRLGACLGILIANGRKQELKKYFYQIIDICTSEIPKVKAANEFSIKELAIVFDQLEKNNALEKEKLAEWREKLSISSAMDLYKKVYTLPGRLNNWAVFAAASEWGRVAFNLNGEKEFVEKQLQTQTEWFDENGCYLEPHNPILYDVVTRLLLCYMLKFGYDGEYKDFLDRNLEKAGLYTLKILSVNAEMPFGGRSNQFIHNETSLVPLFLHEAERNYLRGNLVLAGQFKSAAERCLEKAEQNLKFYKGRHVKNFYDVDSNIGCESYAYFEKYMITTASNLQLALYYEVDEIESIPSAFEKGGYVFETSKEFSKVFMTSKEYSLQLDLSADENYDGAGVGRIHKRGAPDCIALSTPFAGVPKYKIKGENGENFSICPAITSRKKLLCGAEGKTKYTLLKKEKKGDELFARFKCELQDKSKVFFTCIVDDNGVEFIAKSPFKKVGICFPAFIFDGEEKTEVIKEKNKIIVEYKGYSCEFTSGKIKCLNKTFYNRNGEYEGYVAEGFGCVTLKVNVQKNKFKNR